jgi:hypothetical protein
LQLVSDAHARMPVGFDVATAITALVAALGWMLGCGGDRYWRAFPLRLLIPAVAVFAIVAQAIPLISTVAIRDSKPPWATCSAWPRR